MKAENETTICCLSRSNNEGYIRTAVAAFLCQLDPMVDELADIKTAVSEAVTNAIVHGYPDRLGKIWVKVSIYPGRLVCIRIKDKGVGIPDVEQAMEPLYTTASDRERAGLGFSVMADFMDKLTVRSAPGAGTTVVLKKTLRALE